MEQGYKTGVLALCIPANTTFPYTILSERSENVLYNTALCGKYSLPVKFLKYFGNLIGGESFLLDRAPNAVRRFGSWASLPECASALKKLFVSVKTEAAFPAYAGNGDDWETYSRRILLVPGKARGGEEEMKKYQVISAGEGRLLLLRTDENIVGIKGQWEVVLTDEEFVRWCKNVKGPFRTGWRNSKESGRLCRVQDRLELARRKAMTPEDHRRMAKFITNDLGRMTAEVKNLPPWVHARVLLR